MKRYGNFWETVISEENLRRAYRAACRSKNKKSRATKTAIRRTGEHSTYKERVIYEPKKRTIYIAKFYPDRVLHHAVVDGTSS